MAECLIDLKIIIEELHKINNNEKLEVKNNRSHDKKSIERIKTEKKKELEWKSRLLKLRSRSFKKLIDYEEEKEVIKVIKKCMEEKEEI